MTSTGTTGLKRNQGFTLVEIAIVLVIIGVILGGVLNARSVLRNARNKDIVKAVADVATAAQQFRDRYGAWPGDLTTAAASIPGLSPTCVGNGNGIINVAESACATEELIRSSMLRGDALVARLTINGTVFISLTDRATAAGLPGLATLPVGWVNVVRVENIDCDTALQIDRAMDDADGTRGNFRIGAVCAGQNENVPVADAVLRLN